MKTTQFLTVMSGLTFFRIAMAMSCDMPDDIKKYSIQRTSWAEVDEILCTQQFLRESLDKIRESSVKDYDEGNLLFFSAKFDELLRYTKFLLKNGAKPNERCKGILPLYNAISNGALQTACLLAQSGALCRKALLPLSDALCYTHDEQTFAAQKSLFNVLVEKGAHINAWDPQTFETPLFKSVRVRFSVPVKGKVKFHEIPIEHRKQFVQLLLSKNAGTQARVNGKTASHRARANGFDEIADMIENSSAPLR